MASSSFRYDVFPSFSGQDVRKSFLSHLLKELRRKLIHTFIDNRIERSLPIPPALLLAIKESRISIVIFSKNYASSTWCLNELVEIHKCFKELKQMVIPIFYDVVPSDVRKQTGEFGKLFKETCKGKPEDHKQSWMQALSDVAKMAGYDLLTWPDEANLIETITNYVSNKLFTPSNDVGDFVGLEAHLERLSSMLCLESEEARMVGIVGPSGIGKSTIGRALYSQHFSKFHHHAIMTYKRTINDDYGMKLSWEQQFLSKILDQNDITLDKLGEVEKRLKHKKVLIVLDDVVELELLKTLVGKIEWFGPGSRIIVITQNRQLLKAHEIDHIHEVEFPSECLALEMLCRYAFGKNSPPDGFRELAVEVAKLAGNLPLGLSVLGSSLKGKGKYEWMKMLPRLRNDLDGKIEKTLRVSYDRLDKTDQELFLSIACFFKGKKVSVIEDLFGDIGLTLLADKFLIRITPKETVEMHDLLQKLGIEIDREESKRKPSRRRFLTNAEDIRDVLTDKYGIKSVLGISLDVFKPFSLDENSFESMSDLQYIIVHHSSLVIKYTDVRLELPKGLNYLPRKLKLLKWKYYPAKCLSSNFNAETLVILKMKYSKLEKLWKGNQPLGSLKKMDMRYSRYLKEIPDLSNAINLEVLNLEGCKSLVTLPSSIQNVPTHLNLESLKYFNLKRCCQLRNFPQISMIMTNNFAQGIKISVEQEEDCLWDNNLRGPSYFDCLMKCIPNKFRPEHVVELTMSKIMLKKLWEGVQSLESLVKLNLSSCTNLTEFPDLSKATNLERLILFDCESLVSVPSTIGNLQKLKEFEMTCCHGLEVLPIDVNLASLSRLNIYGCSRLRTFPQISKSIKTLILDGTAIEEVPCCIDNFSRLTSLKMTNCESLKTICPKIFRLTHLKVADFSYCAMVTMEGFLCIRIHVWALQLLSNSLEFVFDSPEEFYRDAKLVLADGREVSFHRCVMSARSPFFKNALAATADKEKLKLKEIANDYEVGFDSVVTVLAYVYSSRMRPPPKGVSECADENCCHVACRPAVDFMLEVLYLAFIFNIPELVTLYQRHLLDVVDKVVIEDTLVILKLANICAKSCTKLFDRCKEIIVKSDLDIVSLDKSLPQDVVKQIIDNRYDLGLEVPKLDKHVSNIHKALDSDDVELVKMLLTEGHTNLDDAYALHFAVAFCDVKTATNLLDLKLADVNHRNLRGNTVLHVAAMRKEPQLILSLLEKGASASETTLEGRTALLIAKRATMAVEYNNVPERCKHSLKGRLCVEILEQGDKRVTIPRDVPPSLAVAAEELKERLLDLENRVALAQRIFPTEAQAAMEIAQMKGTCEFIVTNHEPDRLTGTKRTSPDVKIAPFKILEEHQSRLKALSKTVELVKRFFPRCSAVLDQIMDCEDLTQLACGEEDTPETRLQKKQRYMEIQATLEKAFSEDNLELGKSSLTASSSSTSKSTGGKRSNHKLPHRRR